MLFFLSRCSNPNAVLAIPAGTLRHRHPLTARRAAWRRSEGRRRRQRKRAQGRPGAGRKSKRAPLQSSTSNDVDDCVTRAGASRRALKRIASALRHRPALVDDRGRRRDRGASFTVAHRADTVKERMEDPRAGKGRRTCAPASRRRPRVFFRSSGRGGRVGKIALVVASSRGHGAHAILPTRLDRSARLCPPYRFPASILG
jgi:hypothetical protein